ncbi:MAG: cyclomaltodextrinase N-terminal domain-containing protein [Muribaculaceae bacterium]|nr:cyclomaltodextrinase N-terminal domain-containing protein [Muribaculaceae bacterium]
MNKDIIIKKWSRICRGLFRTGAFAVCVGVSAFASLAFEVKEIQPPHWWTGMKDSSLQLQVFGRDIRPADVRIDYPGVTLDSVVRLDGSPDWQYLYLSISPDAKPGKFKIEWKEGKKKLSREYELKARREQRGAKGFSSADVLYMVMPDRFSDGDVSNNNSSSLRNPVGADRSNPNRRHGGDIRGLINHAAYIDSLGMTTLWVAPVLENDMRGGSYHGYATTDYYRVDPRFGTNAEYAELIDTLHNRGIKTVMDMIFNHSGSGHPWFSNPPASNWFNYQGDYKQTNYRLSTVSDPYASDYDRSMTQDGWFVRDMPDLNQRNPHLMKYLIQNSIWWVEEAQIDGIRMDTYPYADEKEMARWIDAVKYEYPDFNIVGECWFGETAGEAFWQKGSPLAKAKGADTNLPVVMDFPLMIKSRGLAPYFEDTDAWNGLNKIYDQIALDYVYPEPLNVLRFLDNHDTERVLLSLPDSLAQWKQAITILLTMPGIPQVYYGTEILMNGTREGGDGNVRKDMPGGFPGDTSTVFTREGRSKLENEAVDYISALSHFRKGSKAIAEGKMKHFMPDNGVYLYQRGDGEAAVLVMMNGRDVENEVDMTRYKEMIPSGAKYKDVITGEIVTVRPESDKYLFSPRETRVMVPVK